LHDEDTQSIGGMFFKVGGQEWDLEAVLTVGSGRAKSLAERVGAKVPEDDDTL